MKKVTTNMTFGQVLFIFFILLASSLMFFYFGAKFGGDILTLADLPAEEAEEPFLPDDKLSAEIRDIISNHDQKLVFHEAVVQDAPPALVPQPAARADVKKVTNDAVARVPAVEVNSAPVLPSLSDSLRTASAAPKVSAMPKAKTSDETAKKVLLPGAAATKELESSAVPKPLAANTNVPDAKPAKPQEDKVRVLLPGEEGVVPSKSFRLQVGSYARKDDALKAQTQWEGRGYTANLVESTIPGKGTWYRLYVGRYGSQTEAQGAQRQIMKSYKQTAMILEN